MPRNPDAPEASMSLLEHLDELRSRLFRVVAVFAVLLAACWFASGAILEFLLRPIQQFVSDGGLVFIHLTEPFMTYMMAAALAAIFLSTPYVLYEAWAFVAPGLYRRERRLAVPFLVFGTLFFVAGGAFGYYVATPYAARWLLGLGAEYRASVTLRSAFQFQSRVILGMGAVFELPIVIFFLARIGLVTPAFLMRHFRLAVLVIAIVSAIITPTGDILTMSVFAGPMVLLYLLGVAVSWAFAGKPRSTGES